MQFKKLDAELVVTTLAFVIVYLISATIGGYLTAIYARLIGDDSAQESGFISLNPFQHIDILGFILLLLFQFGWGRTVPLNGANIHAPHRKLKLFSLYFIRSFIHFLLATLSFFLLSIFYKGMTIDDIISEVFVSTNIPLGQAYKSAGLSPFQLAIALLLIIFVFYNLFRAVFSLVIDGIRFFLFIGAEEGYSYMEYADILFFWGPIIFIFFFADPLRLLLFSLISHLVSFIVG